MSATAPGARLHLSAAPRPWRRCGTRLLSAAALMSTVVVLMALLGLSWSRAAGTGAAGVGTWSVAGARHELRPALVSMGGPMAELARAAPAVGLGLCVAGAALASALGGPPLVVLGVVDVVVANLAVAVAGAHGWRSSGRKRCRAR